MAVGGVGTTSLGGFMAAGGVLGTGGFAAVGGSTLLALGGTSTLATGGTSTGTGPYTVLGGGFVTAGAWQGYAWASAGPVGVSTITPTTFGTITAGAQLCVSGTVGATSDYSGTAMLGINIAQAQGTTVTGTWTPTGTGVSYSITNTGASPIRIQIQGLNGATDATQRWCYTALTPTGTIPWASFNTQCWTGGTGVAFSPTTPIAAIMVLVPGSNTAAVPFNFCVVSLAPM
jgi:hypothetical protein